MGTGFFQRREIQKDFSLVTELEFITFGHDLTWYFYEKEWRLTGGVVQNVGGYFCYTVLFPLRAGVFFGKCNKTLFLRIEPDRHETVRGI